MHVTLENHFYKILINPYKGYYIKEEDKLPWLLVASAMKLESIELNLAVELIMN